MRAANNSRSSIPSDNTITPDGSRIIWGFMFENSYFTEFERHNHSIIETAFQQRKKKSTSHFIEIEDANLPEPRTAKVYFGVAQNHLRMPGTRYYVTRQLIRPHTVAKVTTPKTIQKQKRKQTCTTAFDSITPNTYVSSQFEFPSAMISSPTSSFSTSSFSSLDNSALYPSPKYNTMVQPTQTSALDAFFSEELTLVGFSDHFSSTSNFGGLSNFSNTYVNKEFDNLNVNTTTQCHCNHTLDYPSINMLEDPNWIANLVDLGLSPNDYQQQQQQHNDSWSYKSSPYAQINDSVQFLDIIDSVMKY